jgi:hypothetical protein
MALMLSVTLKHFMLSVVLPSVLKKEKKLTRFQQLLFNKYFGLIAPFGQQGPY